MIEKLIDELVDDYTKNVVSSFKIVAGKAYRDGIEAGLKLTRQLLELENTEFDYGHSTNVRDDDY
jgi:hypothetical protein